MGLQTMSSTTAVFTRLGWHEAAFLLALAVFVPQGASADCEGGPVFPETIYAQDKDTFAWQTPIDVEFVKGDIHQLQSYTAWLRGSLATSNSLDVSGDNVGPGYGVYYLVKPASPPCGSWQSSSGAEPSRDLSIPPSCNDVPIDEEMMDAAAAIAFAAASHPWSNGDDAQLYFQIMQDELGCALELPQGGDAQESRTTNDYNPNDPYDPNEVYCGINFLENVPGFSHGPIVGQLYSSQCMNMKCFNHDYDYFTNCVGGICAFSIQTAAWDAVLEDGCHNAPAGCLQLTNPFYLWDLFVCGYVKAAVWSPINDPLCIGPPCGGPGEECCPTTSQCSYEAPESWWPAEGNANDVAGSNHGTLVNGVTFGPGVLGQAFSFDGVDDYVDFGDVLNNITVPFTVEGWIKTPGATGLMGIFWSDEPGGNSVYAGFWLNLLNNRLSISYGDGGSCFCPNDRRTKTTNGPIPVSQWVHIAAVVHGNQDMDLVVNGQDAPASYSGSGGPMVHNASPARLGIVTSDLPFLGSIDEFAVYSRALTQQEIQQIVMGGHTETCPGQ